MLTLLSFNLGNFNEQNIRELGEFLSEATPDVIGLYEASWAHNTNAVSYLKDKLGLPYSFIATSPATQNHTLLLSRYTLESPQAFDSFVNSGAIATLKTPTIQLSVAAVHLAPSPEHTRVNEIKEVLESIDYLSNPVVLMGDFNAISEHDAVEYTGTLQEPIQYDTTHTITTAGFIDTGKSNVFSPTVPFTQDGEVTFKNLRLDYIYINDHLNHYPYTYRVITSSQTPNLSDHHPVLLNLEI